MKNPTAIASRIVRQRLDQIDLDDIISDDAKLFDQLVASVAATRQAPRKLMTLDQRIQASDRISAALTPELKKLSLAIDDCESRDRDNEMHASFLLGLQMWLARRDGLR